jgi:hypothetical protein
MHLVCFTIQVQEKRNAFFEALEGLFRLCEVPDNLHEPLINQVLDTVVVSEASTLRASHDALSYAEYNDFAQYKPRVEQMLEAVSEAELMGAAAVTTLEDLLRHCGPPPYLAAR